MKLLVGLSALVALTACGGGNDQNLTASTPAPTPSPVDAPASTPAPAPTAKIARIDLAQSFLLPSSDSDLVLVSGKDVLVKVNVTSTATQEAPPSGSLRVETANGQLVEEFALTAPTGPLPSTIPDVPGLANSYYTVVPANRVVTGMQLTARVGQDSSTVQPRVGGGVAMTFVAVPVQIADLTGQVVSLPQSYIQVRMPFAKVTLQSHAPYVAKSVTTLPTTDAEWATAYDSILWEVDSLRTFERASAQTFYFGFLPKRVNRGLVGLSYQRDYTAVGWDMPSRPDLVLHTVVHELGHNLGAYHAPCGNPTSPDSNYPYANALLGAGSHYVWGFNAATSQFVDPHDINAHDVMSYCAGDTFSDYNYRKMQGYLTPADSTVKANSVSPTTASQELLLISGRINSGQLELSPIKSLYAQADIPNRGPYVLRIVTAQGSVEYPFAAKQIDHSTTSQHFTFTIPHPGKIVSVAVIKDGETLMKKDAPPQPPTTSETARTASLKPQVEARVQNGVLRLVWDNARYPYLTVTHVGRERSTLAQDLEGGNATLSVAQIPSGGDFEFSLSDGLNSVRAQSSR